MTHILVFSLALAVIVSLVITVIDDYRTPTKSILPDRILENLLLFIATWAVLFIFLFVGGMILTYVMAVVQ